MTHSNLTRAVVEDFLYKEADLLDDWQLNAWLALYTEDARYLVPSADLPRDASPETSLFYIADDHQRMQERVVRLMKKGAHSEYPRSRTRHIVSNVRIEEVESGATELRASAAFVVYRSKNAQTDVYVGKYKYVLRLVDDGLRISEKRCDLDLEALRPQGRVSIIL